MSYTFTVTEKIVTPSGTVEASKAYTGEGQISISQSCAIANDTQLVLAVDVSQIKAMIITADQDLLLETNASNGSVETLSLVANVPYVWTSDSYNTCKFTVDITTLYVTNASSAAATLKIEILYDATA